MSTESLPKIQGRETSLPPRPPFWARMSIVAGNLLQLGGLALGCVILYVDGQLKAYSWSRCDWAAG